MNTRRVNQVFATILLVCGSALSAADLTGTYSAPNAKLTLTENQTKAGPRIEGTLKIGDKSFPLSGQVNGETASGTITDDDQTALEFTVRPAGGGVELSSDGVTVRLTRDAALKSNPLSAVVSAPPADENSSPEPTSQAAPSKFPATYTNPIGFSLKHPESWKAKELNGTAALVPDDAPQVQGQLGELYALAVAPRGDLSTSDDLVAKLREEMAAALPGLAAVGEPVISGRSVLLRFEGPENGGVHAAAGVRATIAGDLIVVMMGLGESSPIRKHETLAGEVFRTVAASPRAIDQQLLGSWTNSSSYSSSTGGGGGFASSRAYTLAADGTYRYTSQTVGGISSASVDSGQSVDTGIWAAKDGVFTKVDAAGNTVRLTYKFVDRHLVVYDASGKRTIWDR